MGNEGTSTSNLPRLPQFIGKIARIEARSVWLKGGDDSRTVKAEGRKAVSWEGKQARFWRLEAKTTFNVQRAALVIRKVPSNSTQDVSGSQRNAFSPPPGGAVCGLR